MFVTRAENCGRFVIHVRLRNDNLKLVIFIFLGVSRRASM